MLNKIVTFGDVMMRLTASGHQRFTQTGSYEAVFGGSEANVAVALAHLGFQSEHVTVFPSNDLGKAARMTLQSHGIDTSHIHFQDGRLGLYFVEQGAAQRPTRIVYDRYDSAFCFLKPEEIDWNVILEGASWFHWSGITPALSSNAASACLTALQVARKKGVTISGDINYRRNLWQYGKAPHEVMPEMIEYCDYIVGGLEDFANCAGVDGQDFNQACSNMVSKFPALKSIATTRREILSGTHNHVNGVLWTKAGIVSSKMYDLDNIVDRIGSGDAFMAGLICGWLNKSHIQDVIELATALCVLKHSMEGDVCTSTMDEAMQLVNDTNRGQLRR